MDPNILNKIQKLLALSNSPNENEALCAAQKASELMLRHHISQSDLGNDGFEKPIEIEKMLFEKAPGRNKNQFNGALASVTANFFNCHIFWSGSNLNLIGRQEDLDSIFYLYRAFKNQINEFADYQWAKECNRTNEHGKMWKHAFRFGMLAKLTERLNQQKRETMKTSSSNSLVIFNEVGMKVADFISNMNLRKGTNTRLHSNSGYNSGYQNGDKLSININNDNRISRSMRLDYRE